MLRRGNDSQAYFYINGRRAESTNNSVLITMTATSANPDCALGTLLRELAGINLEIDGGIDISPAEPSDVIVGPIGEGLQGLWIIVKRRQLPMDAKQDHLAAMQKAHDDENHERGAIDENSCQEFQRQFAAELKEYSLLMSQHRLAFDLFWNSVFSDFSQLREHVNRQAVIRDGKTLVLTAPQAESFMEFYGLDDLGLAGIPVFIIRHPAGTKG